MKSKKLNKACIDKKLGLPTVFIRFHGTADFGFNFLIDTSVRHNLIDPCFFKDWIVVKPPTEEELAFLGELAQYPPVTATCQEKGKKRVICKDGIRRACDMIKLDFTIDEKKYSELFAIDESLCQYFKIKELVIGNEVAQNKTLAGVLGNNFLKKHKWILDYSAI